MRTPLNSECPNCRAQIVIYPWGWECSMCRYTYHQWVRWLASAQFPLHTDSPALAWAEVALHE